MSEPSLNLSNYTLAERQMYFYNGSKCPYCFNYTEIVDSEIVYQQSHGLIYYCKDCQAWVGMHNGTDQALGTLAKKNLRDKRRQAHALFDPLWEKKVALGFSKTQARKKAYQWVTNILMINPVEAHIAYFNEEQCDKLIAECKKFTSGTEENKKYVEEEQMLTIAEQEFLDEIHLYCLDAEVDVGTSYFRYRRLIYDEKEILVCLTNKTAKIKEDGVDKWKKVGSLNSFIKNNLKNK